MTRLVDWICEGLSVCAKHPLTCDNKSAPGGAVNTLRGLTRSSDSTREGLVVKTTRTCSVPGCEGTYLASGYCNAHYRRLKRFGDPLAHKPLRVVLDPAERLRAKAVADAATGCIEWTGNGTPLGYGVTSVDGKPVYTHRLAWELANGRRIPDGLFVCHRCDNPPCCNPDHLFLGTPQDNMRDMVAKGRGGVSRGQAGKTHCPQGHGYTPENTYVRKNGHRQCRKCLLAAQSRRVACQICFKEMRAAYLRTHARNMHAEVSS